MLVTAGILFAVAFTWIFSPRKKDTFNIHIDKGTAVSVSQSEDGGIRLDFNYESYETRPSDDELFPDIVNTAGPTSPLTRDFWQQVASIDELLPEEKERLCGILTKYGIIDDNQAAAILYGDGPQAEDYDDTSETDTNEEEPTDIVIEEDGSQAEDEEDEDDEFERKSLID